MLWDLRTDRGIQAERSRGGSSTQQCRFLCEPTKMPTPPESSTSIHRVIREFALHPFHAYPLNTFLARIPTGYRRLATSPPLPALPLLVR